MSLPATPSNNGIIPNDRRTINGWAMYDWANSVFVLVITSAIFPHYYTSLTATDGGSAVRLLAWPVENTAALSITYGIAFGLVALVSPLLSSIADYKGNHKSFMRFFCYLGASGCIVLFFFDHYLLAPLALAGIFIGTIGYSASLVFYNSYLPAIATTDQQDKVSARGFSYGYIGSTTLLILAFLLILNQDNLGVSDGTLFPRLAFLLTGIWWIGFAQFAFSRLPKGLYNDTSKHTRSFAHGYQELVKIWHELKQLKAMRLFLASFFFYIMGVQTVMFMAAAFGEKELQLGMMPLMITVLILEYIAIGGAYLFAIISKRIGNIRALMIAVAIWVGICIGAYFIRTPFHFYTAAFFIGLVMGGIQSLSRSTYAKMMPKTKHNAGYFSFYDVSEKIAMMCGLLMFGLVEHNTGSMRNSIVGLATSFAIGLCILWIMHRRHSVTALQSAEQPPSVVNTR